jgi:hypothetical protein
MFALADAASTGERADPEMFAQADTAHTTPQPPPPGGSRPSTCRSRANLSAQLPRDSVSRW